MLNYPSGKAKKVAVSLLGLRCRQGLGDGNRVESLDSLFPREAYVAWRMGRFAGTEFPELLGKMKRGRMSAGWRSRSKVPEGGGRDERVSDCVKLQGCLCELEQPQGGRADACGVER